MIYLVLAVKFELESGLEKTRVMFKFWFRLLDLTLSGEPLELIYKLLSTDLVGLQLFEAAKHVL